MSVEAQTVEYVYDGDGVTKTFPFPSKFLSSADVIVGLDGQEQTGGFSVVGAGAETGGAVTFTVAPAAGVRVALLRKPPASQLIDFVNGQTILEDVLDTGLDKLTMLIQYLLRGMQKSVRLSEFDSSSLEALPSAASRANSVAGFDVSGTLELIPKSDFAAGLEATQISLTFSQLPLASIDPSVQAVMTSGYYTPGDGGGAVYVLGADNPLFPTSFKQQIADGRWAVLVTGSEVNLACVGVRLNAPGVDQSGLVQAAMDTGLNILLPAATIGIGAPLSLKRNGQSIRGVGGLSTNSSVTNPPTSTFKHLGGTFDLLTISPNPISGVWTGNTVKDIAFDMSLASDGHAVNVHSIQRLLFMNLFVNKPVRGIITNNLNTPTFFFCRIVGARGPYAWRIRGQYGLGWSTDALRMELCSGGGAATQRNSDGLPADPDANNETIGLWLDGSVAGGYIFGWTGQSVRNSIYCTVDSSDAGHYPAGITFVRCGGDFLAGPTVYVAHGVDLKFFHVYSSNNQGLTSQSHGGDGIVLLAGARDIDFWSGDVKSARGNGVYVAGENIRFHGMRVYRNGVDTSTLYDNFVITSTAKRVSFDGASAGHNIYSPPTGYPVDGRARYGINISPSIDPGQVVINGNCDFRGNETQAINTPSLALFPAGVPLGVEPPGPNRADNGAFSVNQLAVADGAIIGNSRIRDRWFAGSSGLVLSSNADGSIRVSSGSSISQTDVANVVAGKRVWVAARVRAGVGTPPSSYTATLAYGSTSKAFTVLTSAANEWEWLTYSAVIPSAETGDSVVRLTTGSTDVDVAEVRYGTGSVPNIWSSQRDIELETRACRRFLKKIEASSANESYAQGRATSSTVFRATFYCEPPMQKLPTSVSLSGAIEVNYGLAGVQQVTGMAFSTGGAGKNAVTVDCTVAGGLTAGDTGYIRSENNTTSYVVLDTGF